jgi:hypothetical protein
VISDLARTLVRDRVEAQMTAQIKLLRGAPGSFDQTTGIATGMVNATTVYEGKARVRGLVGGVVNIGEDQTDIRQSIISIPISAPIPHVYDVVLVLDDTAADTDLTGRLLQVTDVEGGSLFGDARRMYARSFFDSGYWSST